MRRLLIVLAVLMLAACTQPVEPAPVINNYYYMTVEAEDEEVTPEETPVAETPVAEPPVVEIPREITDFERFAIYVIDPTGAIFCETHCEEWIAYGYAAQADLFAAMLPLFQLEASSRGAGWLCIFGQLYI